MCLSRYKRYQWYHSVPMCTANMRWLTILQKYSSIQISTIEMHLI